MAAMPKEHLENVAQLAVRGAESEGAARPSPDSRGLPSTGLCADQVSLLGRRSLRAQDARGTVPTRLSPPGAARGAVHTSGLSSDTSAKETGKGAGYPGRMHAGGNSPDSLAKTCVQTAKPKRVQKACRARSSTSSPTSVQKTATLSHPRLPWLPPTQRPGDPQPRKRKREAIQGGLIQATLAWLEHLFF